MLAMQQLGAAEYWGGAAAVALQLRSLVRGPFYCRPWGAIARRSAVQRLRER